jgi:hypothetical protein
MARTYRRDARGRFASGGYSGQSGGRGARLTATGTRKGGGARMTAARPGGTVSRSGKGKPGAAAPKASSSGKVYRTRGQAAAAQRERNRRLFEFSRSAPGYDGRRSDRGIKIRKTTVNQANLLTGRADRVTVRSRTTQTDSAIGQSSAAKKTQQRRQRAETRYESLLEQQRALPRVRRGNAGSKNVNSMATVARAFREYDMGTGRRSPRRRTGRR